MKKVIVFFLLVVLILSSCSVPDASTTDAFSVDENSTGLEGKDIETLVNEEVKDEDTTTYEADKLLDKQKNYAMLCYLCYLSEKIISSKDNRLMLDEIYASLINDTNPDKIDEKTQTHIENLTNIIDDYFALSVKREQVQYMYNQQKADAIKNVIPNPLSILSISSSVDWKRFAASVMFSVFDAFNNYKSSVDNAENEFLVNGWELDAQEREIIQRNRKKTFNYMVDIVQEYELDGKLTLNEEAIKKFVEISSNDNLDWKIQRLAAEQETYEVFGSYWLELANCYFEKGEYKNCLLCIDKYKKLDAGIFRKDYDYAKLLPNIIIAAQYIYSGNEYENVVLGFVEDIEKNTDTSDWDVRYFAAQVYIDLYAKTNNSMYLNKAYEIVLNNVPELVIEQKKLNSTYLEDVKEETIDEPNLKFLSEDEQKLAKKEYRKEKKRIDIYNKQLKENRKTELSPVYEPLILNCDLLFALAEKLNVDDSSKARIEGILETDKNGVFLSDALNERYCFSEQSEKFSIEFNKNEIVIPANLLSQKSSVSVCVFAADDEICYDDWNVIKVDRNNSNDIENFKAVVSNKNIKNQDWSTVSEVVVQISDGDSEVYEPLVFNFRISEYKENFMISDKVVFEAV